MSGKLKNSLDVQIAAGDELPLWTRDSGFRTPKEIIMASNTALVNAGYEIVKIDRKHS